MARLLIVEGADGPREIQLQPGVNRLGRIIEDNHFQVPDASVSSHHCEVEWNESVVTVRDLGSTNGTFLNGELIQEGALVPGHKLRLGTVEMIFESHLAGAAMPPPMPPVAPPARAGGTARVAARVVQPLQALPVSPVTNACRNHPTVAAQWCCVKCGMLTCKTCVKTIRAGMHDFRSCPACGSACMAVAEYKRATSGAAEGFFQLLPSAFSYPFKKDGWMLLIIGTMIFGFLDGVRNMLELFKFMAGMIGLAYWLSLVMGTGYLFAAMQNIVVSSSDNEDALPDWPEIGGFWESMLQPFLRIGIIWALCLGPGLVTMLTFSPVLGGAMMLVGLVCLPIAILAVSIADSLTGLNPIILFSGIGKLGLQYVVTCGIFLVLLGTVGGIRWTLKLTGIPVLPTFIAMFCSLYGIIVEMRLLGLLYFCNRKKLAWFS